ncbi:hypothetical protein GN956_G19163 [Arapaima gigas]
MNLLSTYVGPSDGFSFGVVRSGGASSHGEQVRMRGNARKDVTRRSSQRSANGNMVVGAARKICKQQRGQRGDEQRRECRRSAPGDAALTT